MASCHNRLATLIRRVRVEPLQLGLSSGSSTQRIGCALVASLQKKTLDRSRGLRVGVQVFYRFGLPQDRVPFARSCNWADMFNSIHWGVVRPRSSQACCTATA